MGGVVATEGRAGEVCTSIGTIVGACGGATLSTLETRGGALREASSSVGICVDALRDGTTTGVVDVSPYGS